MISRRQDPHNLNRFVEAQAVNYDEALAELRAGRKRTHWSWYILPQIQGLGSSTMSVRYAISGLPEAKAFIGHQILGARLRECVAAMNAHSSLSVPDILGEIDAKKFHSCVTLFAEVTAEGSPFHQALTRHFAGARDPDTITQLARQAETK